MSMPVITLTPSTKTGVSPPEITKNTRDASFSSYLDGSEETFVLKFQGTTTTQSHNSNISTPHDHTFLVKNKIEEREIDVFDAERYFNEGLNQSPAKVSPKKLPNNQHQHKKDDPLEIFAIKGQPPIAAQSIRSESSSNSRSALLRNRHQPRKPNKKNFLASISCNCSCADKNSVDIDDYTGDNCSIKSVNTGFVNGKAKQGDKIIRKSNSTKFDEQELKSNSQGNFSIPFFTSNCGKAQARDEEEAAAMRKSLEVFGSPILENRKNLTKLTWDAIAGEEININSISNEMNHDSDSDASSDLFEIESFSKGNLFLSRQTSDGLSGCRTPTTCYAPSEASIEWSVVTASAAEFSVLSDSEELVSNPNTNTMTCPQKIGPNSKIGPFKEIPKIRSGILSGCRSHKAVGVAGDAHRANDHGFPNSRKPHRIESFKGMTRFHDESKASGFDSRNGRQSENAPYLLYI